MKIVKFFKENDVDWVNFAFIAGTPLVAVLGLIFCLNQGVASATWILTLVMTIMTGLGVTAGYHRLFSHRSYQAAWPVKLLFLILGAASFQNSALKWSADHRDHHQFVDTDRDPYNIKKGFWYAHVLWVILKNPLKRDFSNAKDLESDPLVRFQHRYYLIFAIVFSFLVPMGIAALWGDPWGGFFIAGFLRVVFNHHMAFCINSVCHYVGNQPYSNKDTSRDSWFVSLFTYGEGFHNFHHTFPVDYRNGVKSYHWDPSKWLIWSLQFLGLTWNLKRVPKETRSASLIRMDEIKLALSQKTQQMSG